MVISDGVLPNATVILLHCFLLYFLLYFLLKVLLHYIVLLYSIPSSTCLLSSFVLQFLSPSSQPFDFFGGKSG